jgi:NitT/TauT family transport system substrate-binding protein
MIRRAKALIGLLALGLVAAACGSGPAPAPAAAGPGGTTAITIGTSPTLSNAALYQANSAGYFGQRKLAATITPVQSGSAAVPLLLNGQLQFTAADPLAAILAVSKSVPLTMVAPGNAASTDAASDSTALLVKADGPIKSVADLAGKTVAVNALNGMSHLATLRTIDKLGGSSAAVKFVELPLGQMIDATSRGQVDGAVVNEPFSTQGVSVGLTKLAAPFSEALPGVPQLVYVAAKPYVAQNRAVVAGFADAITEANGYLGQHPDDVRTIGRTSTQTPPEVLDKIVLPRFDGRPLDSAAFTPLMDLMVQYKVLPAPIDLATATTTTAS